jgi:hypothetical protein
MSNAIQARLVADWKWLLKNAWSVRLMVLAALLSGAEVVLPLYSERIPHGVFAISMFFVTAAALIARFVAQPRET